MKKFLLLSGILTIASGVCFADNFKLGYIDVSRIFATSKPAVAVKEALRVKFSPQQKSLQAMNNNLIVEQSQMQAIMKKASTADKISPSDKAKLEALEAKYQKDQQNFQQKYMVFQQGLQRAQDFASAKVLGQANTILKGISDRDGYDLVVTSNQLVYAKPKYDLTDQVIVQLDKMDTTALIKQLNAIENQPLTPNANGSGIQAPVAVK